jgi:hypothetical protein
MGNGAAGSTNRRTGRTRPLCRDYGTDPRATQLAESIAAHQQTISKHEGSMLGDIAEFDQTEAWRGDGALSMADWLVGRLHVSRSRARMLVEAARRGAHLPALRRTLAAGAIPIDVFSPLAAVATRATDADLADAAPTMTPKQARALAAHVKGATDAQAAGQYERRYLRFDDERCLVWAQLTKDAYAMVRSAITSRARRHDHPSASDPGYERFESRCADALLDLCLDRTPTPAPARTSAGSTATGATSAAPRRGTVTMVVHTDLERLLYGDGYGHASIEGVGPISAEVARRLACSAELTLSFEAPDGGVLDQKPLLRDPTDAQRIEIARRDGGCRFPGCGCRTLTDVHHVRWVSKQGATVLSNLLTLCAAHHSRVHELGWTLDGDAQAEVRFTSPTGQVFVSMPAPTWRPMRT